MEANQLFKSSASSSVSGSDHSFYMDSSLPVKFSGGASYSNPSHYSPLPASPVSCKSDTTGQVRRMCRKMNKLKGELEVERLRNRRLHSSQAQDLLRLHEHFEKEKQVSLQNLEGSLRDNCHEEIEQVIELLRKEKDNELNEVLKYKDEEVKQLKKLFVLEKEDAIRVALEIQQQELRERSEITYVETIKKLKEEILLLRSLNKALKENYQEKCREDNEKLHELNRIKEEFRAEFQRILNSNKLVSLRELDKMKQLEQSIFGENSTLLDSSTNCLPPSHAGSEEKAGLSYLGTPKLHSLKESLENDLSKSGIVVSMD